MVFVPLTGPTLWYMLTFKSTECVSIENDSYSIIESSTIKKNDSSTETVEHEGAVEE